MIIAEAWGRQKARPIPDLYETFQVDVQAISPATRIGSYVSRAGALARRVRKKLRDRSAGDRGA